MKKAIPPLGVIDTFGATSDEASGDDFAVASLGRSAVLHHTSLDLDERTRVHGPSCGHLFVVADGSPALTAAAVDELVRYFLRRVPAALPEVLGTTPLEDLLPRSFADCRERLEVARADGEAASITFGFALWPRLWVVHSGTSRAYVLRDGALHQLTADHTLARRFVAAGILRPEEERRSPLARVPERGAGPLGSGSRPEVRRVVLHLDDELVLCNTGLARSVGKGALTSALLRAETARDACGNLLREHDGAGGASVVVARFLERADGGAGRLARVQPEPRAQPGRGAEQPRDERRRERPRYGRVAG